MTSKELERCIVNWSPQQAIKERVEWEDKVLWAITPTDTTFPPEQLALPYPVKKHPWYTKPYRYVAP